MSDLTNEELAALGDDDLLYEYSENPYAVETKWPRRLRSRVRRLADELRIRTAKSHRFPVRARRDSVGDGYIRQLEIQSIVIPTGRRPIDDDWVSQLVTSIEEVGLLSPPVVMFRDDYEIDGEPCDGVAILVAGRHRLEAMRRLGLHHAACIVVNVDDMDAELMEISENLHRAELTALQRDEQVARWIELTRTKREGEAQTELGKDGSISRQPDAKPGRPEGGVRAAARELGLSEPDARRAVKVAGLSPQAKAAAVGAGLDDNRTALLTAAKEVEPEKQVEALVARAAAASTTRQEDPEIEARIMAREERVKVELAAFLADVDAMEPLLKEIEFNGFAADGETEVPFAYDDLTYIQFAGRYKPIIACGSVRWGVGFGGNARDASRRVESAMGTVMQVLRYKARGELGEASAAVATPADPAEDFTPPTRTPMGREWERDEAA